MTDRARSTHRLAICAWLALTVLVAAWPFVGSANIGALTTALALVPLLLPIVGILRGNRRSFRLATLVLAPTLAITLTEFLVNRHSHPMTGATLFMILLAFASLVAALRASEGDAPLSQKGTVTFKGDSHL